MDGAKQRALFEEAWAIITKYYENLSPRNIFKIARVLERPEASDIVKSFLFESYDPIRDAEDPLKFIRFDEKRKTPITTLERYVPAVEEVQEAIHQWGFSVVEATEYVIARRDSGFDDRSVETGIGTFVDPMNPDQKTQVMVIGLQKGSNFQEMTERNKGLNRPWGYWKAIRAMRLAERLRLPIVTFVDSLGADNSLPSEINDQSGAVSYALQVQQELTVPAINFIVGEAGSAGSMTPSQSGPLYMWANASRFVAAPEGSFSIANGDKLVDKVAAKRHAIDKDTIRKQMIEAWADALHADAERSFKLGTIKGIIPEVTGGAHRFPKATYMSMGEAIGEFLRAHQERTVQDVRDERYAMIRSLGSVKGKDYVVKDQIPVRTKSLITKAAFTTLTNQVLRNIDPELFSTEDLMKALSATYKEKRSWIGKEWLASLLAKAAEQWNTQTEKSKANLKKILIGLFKPERLSIQDRLEQLVDKDASGNPIVLQELNEGLADTTIIPFNQILAADFPEAFSADELEKKLEEARRVTGSLSGMFTGYVKIGGVTTMLIVKDPRWVNSSDTSSAVGEKVALALEKVLLRKYQEGVTTPVIMINSASGARQQDGQRSMDLLTKKMAVLVKLKEAKIPVVIMSTYFSFGGDSASDTTYQDADLLMVETGAIKGFTGPKVVLLTEADRRPRLGVGKLNGSLPQGYQTARFLDQHRFVDHVATPEEEPALLRAFVQRATGKTITDRDSVSLLDQIQARRNTRVEAVRSREFRLPAKIDIAKFILLRTQNQGKKNRGTSWRFTNIESSLGSLFRDNQNGTPVRLTRTFAPQDKVNATPVQVDIIRYLLTMMARQIEHGKNEKYVASLKGRAGQLEKQLKALSPDAAMVIQVKPVGGINLDPSLLNLQIKRDANGVPLPMRKQSMGNIKIDGVLPVIIKIVPIDNLPLFLGMDDQKSTPQLAFRT